MENCLIECVFDGAWVLQESKKNVLPVEVLIRELTERLGAEAVTTLNKHYSDCRLLVCAPEQPLRGQVQEILRAHWGDEGQKVCACSVRALSPAEAGELADTERQRREEKAARQLSRAEASAVQAPDRAEAPHQAEAIREQNSAPQKEPALAAIRALVGAQEFKALAEELAAVAPRIRQTQAKRAFSFQHYLFAINDGCGLTTALERFADLVEELGLFSFPAKKRVLEWSLEPPAGDEAEPLQKVQEFLHSRNRFKGILCLDISHWISRVRDPKFQRMLRAVGEADTDTLFVFRVPYIQADVLESVRRGLADVLYTRAVTFVPFSNEEYADCARRLLRDNRFTAREDVWPVFHRRLAEEKSGGRFYGLDTVDKMVNEMIYRKLLHSDGTDTAITGADIRDLVQEDSESSGLAELDAMVGMEPVRDRILEMVAQVQMQREMAERGQAPEPPCLHMRFVGSPGTGKTTVARIVGKILREKGILEIGNFYEVSGRSLCGRYVGETAPKTSEICRSAYGSVLFIDEAYSLYAGDDNTRDYGKEAIDTLIAEMENNRDKLVVILSGYPDEMETLMRANPGLAGRIPHEIRFPNYSREQLTRIFLQMAGKAFPVDAAFEEEAAAFFGAVKAYKQKDFGNARLARNLYERVWAKAAVRHQLNREEPVRLMPEDLRSAVADREFQQLLRSRETGIGFTAAIRSQEKQSG